jgi:hypothetical protein
MSTMNDHVVDLALVLAEEVENPVSMIFRK